MFVIEVSCSDEDCELSLEAIADLPELELLVCDDCGCCLQVMSLAVFEATELQPLRERLRAA